MSEASELTPAEVRALAARGLADPGFFYRTFLTDMFPGRMPHFHKGIAAVLSRQARWLEAYPEDVAWLVDNFVWTRPDGTVHQVFRWDGAQLRMDIRRNTLIMVPRGFAKTTLCNAELIRATCYGLTDFTLLCSAAQRHANQQLANIRNELAANPKIRKVFGDLRPQERSGHRWAEDQAEATNGVVLAARGRGAQIRGVNVGSRRPDRAILDDIEDEESVATAEQREKTTAWAYRTLMPAVAEHSASVTITALGTLLHPDSVLEKFAKDPDWTVIRLSALDRAGNPIWPELWDEKKLAARKGSMALVGQLAGYYLEFHNVIRGTEESKFRPDFFRQDDPPEDMSIAIALDPAISEKAGADESVIAVVGMGRNGHLWVLDMWAKQGAAPRELIDQYFAMAARWRPYKHGVESIAYQAALIHLLREEMFRKKQYFEITPITHAMKKTERILGILQPRYANGYIHHARYFPKLETQLLDFPMGHDDHPDAVAMAVALLDPYAAAAAGDFDLEKDEYEPIEDDWRMAP